MLTITRPDSISSDRLDKFEAYDYSEFYRFPGLIEYGLANCDKIRRQKKSALLTDFMTCDIETTTLPAGTEYNKSEFAFAVPYLYQVYLFGRVIFFRDDQAFAHFIEFLDDYLAERGCTIVCYIHNASYEYQFFKSRISIDFDSVFALQSRRIGKWTTGRGGIEFRCSYLLSNMSLEKFTENYCSAEYRKDKELIDYEELRFPWSELSNEVLYYSGMDVITLYHAVDSIMSMEHDNIKTIPMTNTGYVRRACRTACIGENTKHARTEKEKESYYYYLNYRRMFEKCAPSYEQYKMLCRAFRGGNTHANRFKAGWILEDVGSFDFASSYPAAVIAYDGFPMGKLMDCTASIKTPDDLTRYASRYWICVTVLFKDLKLRDPYNTLCPYIPLAKGTREWVLDENGKRMPRKGYYDNGRLLYQEGYFEFTFLGCEWDIIRKQYTGEMKVLKAFYTVPGQLPHALRKTCFDWYKAKTELKNVDGMDYEYMKSKNRVNSVYGMMVEKIVKDVISVDQETGSIEQRAATEEEAREQIEAFLSPRNRKFLLYQWGVTVTAICRVRHMEIIDLFGRDFVYGDTDSVKTEHADRHMDAVAEYNRKWVSYAEQFDIPIRAYTKTGEEQILGYLDYEASHHSKQFITLGAKKYCAVNDKGQLEITVAGVPKKIGAQLLGDIKNFKPGFVFKTSDNDSLDMRQNWKKLLTYRDDLDEILEIEGHKLHVKSCIAMERTEYALSITEEYEELTGYHDKYDTIYEEDPEIWPEK